MENPRMLATAELMHICEGIDHTEYLIHVGFSYTIHEGLPFALPQMKIGPRGVSNLSRITQLLQSASNPISPHITQKPLPTEFPFIAMDR